MVTITIGDFGSNASYTCETGYMLNGDMTRMCQDSGDWSGSAPTCDRKLNYMALLYCFYDLILIHYIAVNCGSLDNPTDGASNNYLYNYYLQCERIGQEKYQNKNKQ